VKSEAGTPTLVVKRRFFWFMPFPQSEYPLTNYREVGTSSLYIVTGDNQHNHKDYVIGENLQVHLLPRKGKRKKVFKFTGYYDRFSLGDLVRPLFRLVGRGSSRANSYTVARANYSNLIDLVREAQPLPLRPCD